MSPMQSLFCTEKRRLAALTTSSIGNFEVIDEGSGKIVFSLTDVTMNFEQYLIDV
jgi:hypothetical protein